MQSCRPSFHSANALPDTPSFFTLASLQTSQGLVWVFFPPGFEAWRKPRLGSRPKPACNLRRASNKKRKAGRASERRKALHPLPPPPRPDLHSNVCLPAPNSELYHVSTANSLFMNKKCGRPTKGRSCLCFVKCAGRQNGAARVTSPRAVQDA